MDRVKVLNLSGVEIPYFFGLGVKIDFEENVGKKNPETTKESIMLHYLCYKAGHRLTKSGAPLLTYEEFIDVVDLDYKINVPILSDTLMAFYEVKTESLGEV